MKTRRIQGQDIQGAMRELRRTLGPEAVILDTRELPDGIEIIAAAGATGPRASAAKSSSKQHLKPITKATAAPSIAPGQANVGAQGTAPRQQTVKARSQRLLGQLDVLNINQDLNALGLSSDVRTALSALLEPGIGNPWINAPALLTQALPATPANLLDEGGQVAILGSTGVGKTTTIAKLAAHFARRHGVGQVALVNTDCYRIGASEQLRRYGRLMGIGVHQLPDSRNLGELLKRLEDKRLVLIDTTGNSHEDPALLQQLQTPGKGLQPVQCYLALSFNTQIAALEKTVRNFSRLSLLGAVLTKHDEAVNMGAALSIVMRHQLPAAFVTTGVRVPADIRIDSPAQLVKNAFALLDKAARYSDPVTTQSRRVEAR